MVRVYYFPRNLLSLQAKIKDDPRLPNAKKRQLPSIMVMNYQVLSQVISIQPYPKKWKCPISISKKSQLIMATRKVGQLLNKIILGDVVKLPIPTSMLKQSAVL